jgi:PHD/YefM family antitoxin component YafN of YafNO toxin-antitoxin module
MFVVDPTGPVPNAGDTVLMSADDYGSWQGAVDLLRSFGERTSTHGGRSLRQDQEPRTGANRMHAQKSSVT